jgi:predicted double-glycine peptidase
VSMVSNKTISPTKELENMLIKQKGFDRRGLRLMVADIDNREKYDAPKRKPQRDRNAPNIS